MATLASYALLLLSVARLPEPAHALDEISLVSTPDASVVAGASHAVTWEYTTDDEVSGTTGDLNPFEIELRSCGGDADQQAACGTGASCGNPYRALCGTETGSSCMDSDGSYDVMIPEDVTAGVYVFSVTYLGGTGWASASSGSGGGLVTGCSESFLVEEAPAGAAGGAALTATAPGALQPGDPFTAQWAYDDGSGQAGGSFEVNLYSCADAACANDRYYLGVSCFLILSSSVCNRKAGLFVLISEDGSMVEHVCLPVRKQHCSALCSIGAYDIYS